MKRDITQVPFRTPIKWGAGSHVCPQPVVGDFFAGCSGGCWWCFCRESEERFYQRYYRGWSEQLVRPVDINSFRECLEKVRGTDRKVPLEFEAIRRGIPVHFGSKSDPFLKEALESRLVEQLLELLIQYRIPVILETKHHYIERYLDWILELSRVSRVAVVIGVLGGSDALSASLEPNLPPPSVRWRLVKKLNQKGIWTAVKWEPVLHGVNDSEEVIEQFYRDAQRSGARHISFFNYRVTNWQRAYREFSQRGYDYEKILKGNYGPTWIRNGRLFFQFAKQYNIPTSTGDIINFPLSNDRESCCGVDGVFEGSYQFTLQRACFIIRRKGFVSWSDMEEITFRLPQTYELMKNLWNRSWRGYYSLADSPFLKIVDRDSNGFAIYAPNDELETDSTNTLVQGRLF